MPDDARNPSTAIAPAATPQLPSVMELHGNILSSPAVFEHLWRVAKAFASSSLVPKHLQNRPENCLVALDMARLLNENPLVVCQNIYFVSDRPGWQAQYLISRLNRSGLIRGRVQWRLKGSGPALEVTAHVVDAGTGEEISETASMKMAEAEGWTKNPKYKSIPEVMLKYRSATFLCRLNYPEIMFGLPATDEIEDMRFAGTLTAGGDGVYSPAGAAPAPAGPRDAFEAAAAGEVVDVEPEASAAADEVVGAPAPERPADPVDAPVRNEEFWSRESYAIAPPALKGGKGTDWQQWDGWMRRAIADAATVEELTKLDLDNVRNFGAYKLANERAWTLLREAFSARAEVLSGAEG